MREQQPQLWQNDTNNLVFADLCNALYERELKKLANETNLHNLQRRISSLSYYIKRASERIIDFGSPLNLDSQNASWIYRQPTSCPGPKQNASDIEKFFRANAKVALVVPIYVNNNGEEQLVLDSIDGVQEHRIHTNEHGWFSYDGHSDESAQEHASEQREFQLIKPMKTTMTCACSGHRWLNQKRKSARALSLREMLLATNINWSNFGKLAARN